MKRPKFITLFIDTADELSVLSDAQTGRLLKALLRYADNGEKPDFSDDTALCVAFLTLKKQIDRDFHKYEETCERRSEAGRKGGAPKGNRNAAKTSKTNKTSEDKDNNKDKDKDKDKYKDNNDDKDDAQSTAPGQAGLTGDILEADEVVGHLNKRAGTHYRPTAAGTRRCIDALLSRGYTAEDMKRVIDVKCAEWLGTDYAKYLRPETLFGERFESYLNTPQKPPKSQQPQRLPKSRFHPWQNGTQDAFLRQISELEADYEVPEAG